MEEQVLEKAFCNEIPQNRSNILPNYLTIDFDATAESVILKFTNYGLDAIDSIKATVKIGNVSKSIVVLNAAPGTTRRTVYINMKKCYEKISVYTVAKDGGDAIGTSTTNGSRKIPSNLLDMWHKGSFSSPSDSLNYHFRKHGDTLGIANIVSYVRSADAFRRNLKGAKKSKVSGGTMNVYRWKKNKKYIDICGSSKTGKIISYGRS